MSRLWRHLGSQILRPWGFAAQASHLSCGCIAQENRQDQANFCCMSCGHAQNADTNAARNIEAAGHAVMACGGDVRPEWRTIAVQAAPAKQEPAEAIQAFA